MHYMAYFEVHSSHPSVTGVYARAMRKLDRDPACLIGISGAHAYAAKLLDIPCIWVAYDELYHSFSMARITAIDESHKYVDTAPSPWTANPDHIIAGLRSMLTDDERKALSHA